MTPTPTRLLVFVGLLLAALAGGTALLASVYHDLRHQRTSRHVQQGHLLAERGDLQAAVREYRAALSLEREHPEAARALALSLLPLGRTTEAESYLRELLRQAPTDGALNRGLARVLAAQERHDEARAAYQRAIYGEWPAEGLSERLDTRFELIAYLTRREAQEEVVAELMRLNAELPAGHTAAARRIADLLVQQGATELGLEVLRTATTLAPDDVDLLSDLAALETAAGRPADARGTLRRALALAPARTELRDRLAVVDRVLALDPTLPGLRLVTRTRRARAVLAAAVEQTRRCDVTEEPIAVLREDAARRLRRPARTDAEAAEEELALAQRLWAAAEGCRPDTPDARALSEVLGRVDTSAEPRA